jgi:putative transposase
MDLADRIQRFKFLIHDRDTKFTDTFDVIFASQGVRGLRTPVRASRANAVAERWIGTIRCELLDRVLIVGNGIRSGAVRLGGPLQPAAAAALTGPGTPLGATPLPVPAASIWVARLDRIGGLIHEYAQLACGERAGLWQSAVMADEGGLAGCT